MHTTSKDHSKDPYRIHRIAGLEIRPPSRWNLLAWLLWPYISRLLMRLDALLTAFRNGTLKPLPERKQSPKPTAGAPRPRSTAERPESVRRPRIAAPRAEDRPAPHRRVTHDAPPRLLCAPHSLIPRAAAHPPHRRTP